MKHDENRDLTLFGRVGKVNYSNKTLQASKSATIGIHMWGRIDFLVHYCEWHFVWDNDAKVINSPTETKSARAQKKAKKEPKLTDKTKKPTKKK